MAAYLHRTTKQYIESANSAEARFNADWIKNPDISAVKGQPTKYWVITGDVVTLADKAGRDAADAAETSARRASEANRLDDTETLQAAGLLALLDLVNELRGIERLTTISAADFKAQIRTKINGS